MSKLVDKERLAKLAAALDARAKAAVKAEEERALAAEQALQGAIDAINNTGNGVLAQAKAYADQQIATESGLRAAEEQRIEKALEDEAAAIRGEMAVEAARVDKKIADDIKVEADRAVAKEAELLQAIADEKAALQKEIDDDVKAEKEEREAADTALANRLAIVEGFFGDNEDGNEISLEGVNKAIEEAKEAADAAQDAADQAQEEVDAVEGRMANAEAAIEVLNGNAEVEGSVAKVVAEAVAAEKGLREAKEAEVAQAMANEAARVNQKIADDIAAESADRVAEEARIEGLVTAEATKAREEEGKLQAAINVLNGDAEVEGSVAKAVKAEADRAAGAEAELAGRIFANEVFVTGYAAKEAKVREDFAAADGVTLQAAKDYANQKITDLVNSAPEAMDTLGELAQAIADHQDVYTAYVAEVSGAIATAKTEAIDAAEDKDEALKALLQAEIDTDVKVVADDLAAEKERLVAREAAVDAKILALENANNDGGAVAAAIAEAKQAGLDAQQMAQDEADRAKDEEADIRADFAAADTALHTAIKNEMAAVIQSLAVGIVDGNLRVALGGIEGDNVLVIKETAVPFVTDEDIDAIIAGLENNEEE